MNKTGLYLATAFATAFATSTQAVTLAADGTWHEFVIDELLGNTLDWIDDNGDALTFSFTLAQPGILKVVDLGFRGDVFRIHNMADAQLVGDTSSVPNPNVFEESPVLDADTAFANPQFSSGSFELDAGAYEITGTLIQSAFYDDEGVEFTGSLNATFGSVSLTAVPLPGSAWLFCAGASLLGLVKRRRAV